MLYQSNNNENTFFSVCLQRMVNAHSLFRCVRCDIETINLEDFDVHIRSMEHHNRFQNGWASQYCTGCDFQSMSPDTVMQHMTEYYNNFKENHSVDVFHHITLINPLADPTQVNGDVGNHPFPWGGINAN